jgi:glycosyltransferase involved in cell wall biosynthesis
MLNAGWRPALERLRRDSRLFEFLVRKGTMPFRYADSAAAASLLAGGLAGLVPGALARSGHRPALRQGKNLRVLFLTSEGIAVAPARVRCYRFAEEMRRRGHHAEVFSFWKDIWGIDKLPGRTHTDTERVAAALRAFGELAQRDFDVVYQQRPTYDVLTTSLLSWKRGTRVIFDIDDWIFNYRVLRPYRVHDMLPHMKRLSETCVVASHLLEEAVSGYFPHVFLVPTYVDTAAFRPRPAAMPAPEKKAVVFGWNGTVFQDFMADALRLLLDAFAAAHAEVSPRVAVELEVLGQGAYLPEVRAWVARQHPSLPVRFRDWVDPGKMNEYLDGIDVGLYALAAPKNDPVAIHRGRLVGRFVDTQMFVRSKSPTKIFEYMAKAIPVISTRLGEAESVVDHGVTGLLGDTREELSRAFVRLALEPELRGRMGEAARRRVEERYSLALAGERLEAVFANALAGEGPRP